MITVLRDSVLAFNNRVGSDRDDVLHWVANPTSASEPTEILLQHPHAVLAGIAARRVTAGNTITTAQRICSSKNKSAAAAFQVLVDQPQTKSM
jgi:hypothetical protein